MPGVNSDSGLSFVSVSAAILSPARNCDVTNSCLHGDSILTHFLMSKLKVRVCFVFVFGVNFGIVFYCCIFTVS